MFTCACIHFAVFRFTVAYMLMHYTCSDSHSAVFISLDLFFKWPPFVNDLVSLFNAVSRRWSKRTFFMFYRFCLSQQTLHGQHDMPKLYMLREELQCNGVLYRPVTGIKLLAIFCSPIYQLSHVGRGLISESGLVNNPPKTRRYLRSAYLVRSPWCPAYSTSYTSLCVWVGSRGDAESGWRVGGDSDERCISIFIHHHIDRTCIIQKYISWKTNTD